MPLVGGRRCTRASDRSDAMPGARLLLLWLCWTHRICCASAAEVELARFTQLPHIWQSSEELCLPSLQQDTLESAARKNAAVWSGEASPFIPRSTCRINHPTRFLLSALRICAASQARRKHTLLSALPVHAARHASCCTTAGSVLVTTLHKTQGSLQLAG